VRYRIKFDGVKELRKELLDAGARVKGKGRREVMDSIAERLAASIARKIGEGVPPPLSQATINMRRSRGNNSTTPLLDTGKMKSRVTSQATDFIAQAWADTFYATFVQLGIRSTSGAIKGKRIPPRPFMVLEPRDVDWATEQVLDFIMGDQRAAA
jgi:phage gpG-like protein